MSPDAEGLGVASNLTQHIGSSYFSVHTLF